MEHKFKQKWTCDGHDVINCESCGFIHSYPYPTKEELDEFYTKQYWSSNRDVTKTYIEDLSKQTKDNCLDNKEFIDIYNTATSIMNKTSGRFLDVGCGINTLAYYFKLNGFDSNFLETSEDAIELMEDLGIEGFKAFVNNFDFTKIEKYDFINASFILEHVNEPIEIIQNMLVALKDDGLLRIAVPNDFSPSHLAYLNDTSNKPSWINYPDHINYFNFETVKNLLDKLGMKEVHRTTNYPLDLLLLNGYNFYKDDSLKSGIRKIVTGFEGAFENNPDKLKEYYESIAKIGFGRRVDMYFTKK